MELWLVCALLTVVCYGVGEGLSKEPTVRLGSARMLVLYAVGSAPIYAAWFFLGSGWERLTPIGMALAIASAVCGCFGTIFWVRERRQWIHRGLPGHHGRSGRRHPRRLARPGADRRDRLPVDRRGRPRAPRPPRRSRGRESLARPDAPRGRPVGSLGDPGTDVD